MQVVPVAPYSVSNDIKPISASLDPISPQHALAPSSRLPPEAECMVLACTECSFHFIIPRTSLPKSTRPSSGAHQVSCPLCRSACHELPSKGSTSGSSSSSSASTGRESMPGAVEAGLRDEVAAAVTSGLVTADGEKGFVDSAMEQSDGCAENNSESAGADGAGRGGRGKYAEDSSETKAEAGGMVGEGELGKGKGRVGEMEGAGKEEVVASENGGVDDKDDSSAGAGCGGGSATAASTGMPAAAASEGEAEEGEAEEGEAGEGKGVEGGAASVMEVAAGSSAPVPAVAPAVPVAAVAAMVPSTGPVASPAAGPLLQAAVPAAATAAGEGAGGAGEATRAGIGAGARPEDAFAAELSARLRRISIRHTPLAARPPVAQHREHEWPPFQLPYSFFGE
ncbi:unnamed protein product [Closterium sp. Naga37s-1]|nr:unnamed protein product [Closterium sp. Naga37s-1]